jgi:uncharacterized protein YbbK (DUF523 family)
METSGPMKPGPPHLPTEGAIARWPAFTPEHPMCVLASGCLAGRLCGVDGSSNGEHPAAAALLALPNVRAVDFCPEDFAFGTPRATPNIYGGDGHDVLDGRARVLTDRGDDGTAGMLRGAYRMLDVARTHAVHLALLMDVSAACGSQVIYDGPRHLKVYRAGAGVAAALLIRSGVPVVSQRDFRTLGLLMKHLGHVDLSGDTRDHHESDWYRSTFG